MTGTVMPAPTEMKGEDEDKQWAYDRHGDPASASNEPADDGDGGSAAAAGVELGASDTASEAGSEAVDIKWVEHLRVADSLVPWDFAGGIAKSDHTKNTGNAPPRVLLCVAESN